MSKPLTQILKTARRKKGLTQKQVADKAGIDSNTYSRIERGTQEPKHATVKRLEKALDVDL